MTNYGKEHKLTIQDNLQGFSAVTSLLRCDVLRTGLDNSGLTDTMQKKCYMVTDATKCVGCLLCQMACSYKFTRTFLPSLAKIVIEWSDLKHAYNIAFAEDCDSCGFCARYCVYDSLTAEHLKKEKEGK